jgi:hypothetical protein
MRVVLVVVASSWRRRRSKFYRVLRVAIRQFFYALKAYNKFSAIIASDMRRTKASVISIYKTITFDAIITTTDDDSDNESVSAKRVEFLFESQIRQSSALIFNSELTSIFARLLLIYNCFSASINCIK